MIVPIVAVIFGAIMVALAVWANGRFQHEDRLPMQWSLSGSVNWSAPRVAALALIPTLGIVVLAIFVAVAMNFDPRPGQEGLVVPTLIGTGSMSVAAQMLHFWLIEKTLGRSGK